MTELACREIIFHFNKKHLEDEQVPPWCLKTKGKTFYVMHVQCDMPWSTKETPQGSTKGSIKVKHAFLQIDALNHARITPLTPDLAQSGDQPPEPLRIGWIYSQDKLVRDLLQQLQVYHSPILWMNEGCSTGYYVCDVQDPDVIIQLKLTLSGGFRQFVSNEWQYVDYDQELKDLQSESDPES